ATGLDLSPAMLAAARRRAVAAGAPVDFVEGDMRDFDLGQRFSLIFVARNSLLHLGEPAEFAALLAAVHRHLAPGGILAFDIFNPDLSLLARPAGQRFPVMRVESDVHGELVHLHHGAPGQVGRAAASAFDIPAGAAGASGEEWIPTAESRWRLHGRPLFQCKPQPGLPVPTSLTLVPGIV